MKCQIKILSGKMRKIAACMLFLTSLTSGQSIIFHSEQIRIDIMTHSCRLTGNYTFRNDSDRVIRQMLYYPFPDNIYLPFPHSITVTDDHGNIIDHENNRSGISFPIHILSDNTRCYSVVYEQSTPEQFFEYILDTTMDWHFPLASAEFIIVVPDNISIEEISLSDYEIIKNGEETRYRIYRENFRSDKNLSIQWRIK
ncbi:MAG: hypothetical protein KAU06_07000 [Candidatus Marinimicrobia bacterium]|nr:hypothetical protein [Candidatus Neomarinimicrobiota bacterium]